MVPKHQIASIRGVQNDVSQVQKADHEDRYMNMPPTIKTNNDML